MYESICLVGVELPKIDAPNEICYDFGMTLRTKLLSLIGILCIPLLLNHASKDDIEITIEAEVP